MKLYQITHQIIDAQHQQVDETQLDKLEIDFRQKAVAYAGVIKNFDSWVESIDNEIKRLKERLKSYLLQEIQKTGIQRIEEGSHRVSVRRSPLKVEVKEPAEVPGQLARRHLIQRQI